MDSIIESGICALRHGRPVILVDSSDREGEGDIAFAGKYCTPELVNMCLTMARGILCISLRPTDAARIGVRHLPTNGKDRFGTSFGTPIDSKDTGSGVSAYDRCTTIVAASDASKGPDDFVRPGHVQTLIADSMGLNARQGHTEAVLALLEAAGIDGPGVLCEILNEKGEMADLKELTQMVRREGFPLIEVSALVADAGISWRPS